MFLRGIRVLDLADEKASFCSKLLADLGAQVIKVEKPGGDPSRNIGPFWNNSPHPERSLFFFYNNTNKLGITLDLKQIEDRTKFIRLVKQSDVVVETFPPGHLEDLGLGFEILTETKPDLILASVTGFGQNGPRRNYKTCDLVASAFGGQMYVSGSPSRPPLNVFGEQSYYSASLFAAIGILLALRKRAFSGAGVHIDISLQEAVAATLEHVMVRFFHDHVIPTRQGNVHWDNSFIILPCKDGFIHMSLFQNWETLVEWMASEGMEEDLLDLKWKDEAYCHEHLGHIIEVLQRWTKNHTAHELFEIGQLMRFPWAPVHSPQDILGSPQLEARGFFKDVDHPEINSSLRYPGLPFQCIPSLPALSRRAPLIDEHNDQVLETGFMADNEGAKSSLNKNEKNLVGDGILKGLTVLDFTRVLAGPYATRILADFGADVIKVQSRKTAKGAESNDTAYFNTWNRNKKSITLDMSYPEAVEIALKLAAISDVLIENFSPRVMSNWGLTYEKVKEIRPDIIMISMSAMGQSGPWRNFVAFGPTLQSLCGLTYLTSYDSECPVGLGYSYADTIAALYGILAVLAALGYREKTGRGLYIDLSEYEALCTLNGPLFLDLFANQSTILPNGNWSNSLPAAPHGCYKCKGMDRWCVISVSNETDWRALCQAIDQTRLSEEDKFSTPSKRKKHSKELDELLERWTSKKSAEEVVRLLQKAGVPAGIVQNAAELADDQQLSAREFFVHLKHPSLGDTISDGTPIKFTGVSKGHWKTSPLLGEDNHYVYTEMLGLTEQELSSYVKRGIIG